MTRMDLPEIADQAWCPGWVRDAMTGYLQAVNDALRPYAAAELPLSELVSATGRARFLDLASGAGGPWPALAASLRECHPDLEVRLSDLRPNRRLRGTRVAEGIEYVEESVSALAVPAAYEADHRTMFTGLHHFSPHDLGAILRDAADDGVGFAAFEATQRSTRGVLVTLLIPVLVLVLMPRVRPRRIVALLFTYLLPVLPLAIWWDGFASTCRTYTVGELGSIVDGIGRPGYAWTVGELPTAGGPIPITAVLGRPAAT